MVWGFGFGGLGFWGVWFGFVALGFCSVEFGALGLRVLGFQIWGLWASTAKRDPTSAYNWPEDLQVKRTWMVLAKHKNY